MKTAGYTLNAVLFGGVLTMALMWRWVAASLERPMLRLLRAPEFMPSIWCHRFFEAGSSGWPSAVRSSLSSPFRGRAGCDLGYDERCSGSRPVGGGLVWSGAAQFLRLKTRFPTRVTLVSAP